MAKLTMTTFVTLDGVTQAPGGPEEDTSGGFTQGGWFIPHADEDFGQFIVGVYARAEAFLLGRKTYEIFAGHWPRVTDPTDPIAGPLNRLPRYVVSRTLERVDWAGSILIRDVESDVARLKRQFAGELQVHGSCDLAKTLLANDLIDEINMVTVPVVLGHGRRLFGPGSVPAAFKLLATRGTGKGVVLSTYQHAGKPIYSRAPPPI